VKPERWRDSIPIAAILGDTYHVPLSPLSGTNPSWQIGVDERFGLRARVEIRVALQIAVHHPILR
jgi:hypothetical protein